LATSGHDRTLRIWDSATGREQAALPRPQAVHHPLAFDASGALAWIENGRVQRWDAVTGLVDVATPAAVGETIGMAFSRDGRLLATVGSDVANFATRLWDLPAGSLRVVLPRNPYPPVICLACAASGRVLATADCDSVVQVWRPDTGRLIRAFPGPPGRICALAFSSDDSLLAGVDVQGTIKTWDVATGREQGSFLATHFSR
jgi:WD40 repeat protein